MAGHLTPTERIAARLVTTGMTAREVVALLAAHDAQIKAEAWDEGFRKGQDSETSDPAFWRGSTYANPYRAGATR